MSAAVAAPLGGAITTSQPFQLFSDEDNISPWIKDRRCFFPPEWYTKIVTALQTTCLLYVGNLSFHTTEAQIHEHFSRCGEVKRVIMGINKVTRTACGFCFVEYVV